MYKRVSIKPLIYIYVHKIIEGVNLSPESRRLVPISESIVREAMDLSGRLGIPFRELIEKILSSFLEVSKMNPHLIETIYDFDLMEDIKRIGGMIIPSNFLGKLLEKLGEKDFDELREELFRSAQWIGILTKTKRGSSPEYFVKILRMWIPDAKIDLIPVPNSKNTYKIVVSLFNQSYLFSELVSSIIEGIAKSFEVFIESSYIDKGVVSIVIRYAQS